MAPTQKGIVPPEHARAILEAKQAAEDAAEAYRTACVDALKAGASLREVSNVSGSSDRTLLSWGHERGWPTKEQKAVVAERRKRNADFRAMVARGIEQHGGGEPQ